ncbi:Ribonuclease H2 subunit C, partial [Penicillium taxi]|uniref:Ribonuclease H2 subunit C n=1 Tax=Penicillium taxi TaxID=168475 RepID=UPI00254563D1
MPDTWAFQPSPTTGQSGNTVPKYTPNVLPCRIHHDGPINSVDRYWTPEENGDEAQTVHFRGRKLLGRRVAVPEGYQGVIATRTDKVLPSQNQQAADEEAEPEQPVGVIETQGTFDEVIVWGHESLPLADDTFVKGVEEWVKFAEKVCQASLLVVYHLTFFRCMRQRCLSLM